MTEMTNTPETVERLREEDAKRLWRTHLSVAGTDGSLWDAVIWPTIRDATALSAPSPASGEAMQFASEDVAWEAAHKYAMDDHTLDRDELICFLKDHGLIAALAPKPDEVTVQGIDPWEGDADGPHEQRLRDQRKPSPDRVTEGENTK